MQELTCRNRFKYHRKLAFVVVLSGLAATLSGCTDEELHSYITEFDTAVSTASSAINGVYNDVNDFKRKNYIASIRLQPGAEIGYQTPVPGTTKTLSTGLVSYYSDAYISARVVAFKSLASYTGGLALLAGSDSPKEAEAAIKTMGDRIGEFGNQIQKFNTDGDPIDVKKFATPISQLIGLVARHAIEIRRDKKLSSSLEASNKVVDEITKELENDLNEISDVKKNGAEEVLARYRVAYNSTSNLLGGGITDGTRRGFLSDIENAGKTAADISRENPAPLVAKIRTIHKHLVEYVLTKGKKKKGEGSIELVADLHSLTEDTKALRISSR